MHPVATETPNPTFSTPAPATDLAPLLRRIFWLVHTIRTWPPQNAALLVPDEAPVSILAAAPFHEWSEVARQIQEDLKPETWRIERKENKGLPARTLILLRKSGQNYQVEILPLRGFKPARFFHDYQRGELLQSLLKTSGCSSFLHLNPNGLYFEKKLVVTNPPDLARFFGFAPKLIDSICPPAQFYSQIAESPFFDLALFCDSDPASQPDMQTTQPPVPESAPQSYPPAAEQEFKVWLRNIAKTRLSPATASSLTKPEIEERIHCINSGGDPDHLRRK
jgi:hypothetical protein